MTSVQTPTPAHAPLAGRVASLTRVNGAEIRAKERVDAEKAYLKGCVTELLQEVEARPHFRPHYP